MADQTQRLEIATVKAEIGSDILSRFSNDAVAADLIPTDSGDIPNLKQVIAEIQEEGADKISFATTIYPNTAAGIAATANGAIFLVKSVEDDEIYSVWENAAGVATDTGKRALSSQAIQDAMVAADASADAAADSAAAAQAAAANAAAEFESIFEAEQAERVVEFNHFLESSGFEVPVDYVAGLGITRPTQTVRFGGELYRGKDANLPFTTTTWAADSAKFFAIGDAALRQEMAAPGGSGLSGYIQKAAGAVPRTADKKLDELPITIEDFLPGIVYVEAPYGQAQVDAATPVDDAFEKALSAARSTGRPLRFFGKVYKCSYYHDLSAPLDAQGVGTGRWQPTVNAGIAGGTNKPNMEGTIFLVTGTYARNKYATGITDCRTAGGVLVNTDIREPGYDSNYKLTSFYNEDANITTGAAATRKAFSAAFGFKPGSRGAVVKNFRIMLSNRGIAGYHAQDLNLGDDVDVGLLMDNTDYNVVENVYVVGTWRIAGRFLRAGVCNNESDGTGGEHNATKGCVFTGAVGDLVRAPDLCRVVGVGSNYIDVPWADNHPYDPSLLGVVRRGESPETFFNFTGVAVVGGNLRLTGVTPDPVAGF